MDFEALERLGRLRASGAIGEDEFESEKQRILQSTLSSPAQAIESASQTIKQSYEPSNLDGDYSSVTESDRKSAIRLPLIAALVVAIVGGGGYAAYRYIRSGGAADSVNSAGYTVRSRVKGIHIGALNELSKNPHGDDSSCSSYEKAPVSAPAKLVAGDGWHVTAEETVGNLNAISFTGACIAISVNAFKTVDGNIGFYENGRLIAVAYGKRVGHVTRDADQSQLDIKSDKTGETVAKIITTPKSISVKNL